MKKILRLMWMAQKPGGVLPYLGYTGAQGYTGATGQGMVFWPSCRKQGIQFDSPLS